MSKYLATNRSTHLSSTAQLEAIENLLVNDHYLFLNSNLQIISYSKNCISLANKILKHDILSGLLIQELLCNIDEDLSELKLVSFLCNNISHETVNFKFQIGGEFLMMALRKIQIDDIYGYACLLQSQPMQDDITEIFDNMHLVANLSWFTSHKLRGPLSAIMSMIDQNSLPEFLNNEHLSSLFIQMRQQAASLDAALHTLNSLLSSKSKKASVIPEIESGNIKNIMMLDDEVITHMISKKIVSDINAEINVFSFTAGNEALEFLKTFPTDLILLDLNMPVMNGWEFLQAMEAQNIKIPTIIVSSSIDTNDINHSFEYPAVKGFINKPIGKADLKRILVNSIPSNDL